MKEWIITYEFAGWTLNIRETSNFIQLIGVKPSFTSYINCPLKLETVAVMGLGWNVSKIV